MTIFSKNWVGAWPLWPPLATPMSQRLCSGIWPRVCYNNTCLIRQIVENQPNVIEKANSELDVEAVLWFKHGHQKVFSSGRGNR